MYKVVLKDRIKPQNGENCDLTDFVEWLVVPDGLSISETISCDLGVRGVYIE